MELPSPGDTFEGKYQIHQIIGRGGFATVYRATDTDVGRDVALKILSPRDGGYPEAVVARFMREARLLAGLQDPHTITMYDFGGTEDGLLFMVFEYVKGLDLSELLKRRGKLEPDEVKHILKQVLYALREAHDAGVLHRDIKPPNLLVYEYMGDPNCVKLLDFGVAKPQESHELGASNLTKKGAMVGTPRYMAPEQIFGKELDASADLYSLGLVAYEMLTGTPAMDGRTNKDRVRQQLSKEPTLVPEEYGTPALRSVINRLIEKDKSLRYKSAGDAIAALRSGKIEPSRHSARAAPVEEANDTIDETGAQPEAGEPPSLGLNIYQILMIGLLTAGSGLIVLILGGVFSSSEDDVVQLGGPDAPPVVEPPPPPTEPPPKLAADPPKPSVGTTGNGCGKPIEPGLHERDSMIGLAPRPWLMYVPRTYDPDKPHQVVLMFHSMFSDPRRFMETSQMAPLADEHGLVLVAPRAHEDGRNAWKNVDDVELVNKALEEVRATVCTSEERIYAMGHGRGGWFARDLGCYMQLSAVAITGSGQHVGEKVCRPLPPVPTIRLYGNTDKLVPMNGGASCMGGDYVSAKAIDAEWRQHYKCADERHNWFEHKGGNCGTWACEMEGARYVSCELNGGHDWPGAAPKPSVPTCDSAPAQFPYRDTIWRFFSTEGRLL